MSGRRERRKSGTRRKSITALFGRGKEGVQNAAAPAEWPEAEEAAEEPSTEEPEVPTVAPTRNRRRSLELLESVGEELEQMSMAAKGRGSIFRSSSSEPSASLRMSMEARDQSPDVFHPRRSSRSRSPEGSGSRNRSTRRSRSPNGSGSRNRSTSWSRSRGRSASVATLLFSFTDDSGPTGITFGQSSSSLAPASGRAAMSLSSDRKLHQRATSVDLETPSSEDIVIVAAIAEGSAAAAHREDGLEVGMVLHSIQDRVVKGLGFNRAMELLKHFEQRRPLMLGFRAEEGEAWEQEVEDLPPSIYYVADTGSLGVKFVTQLEGVCSRRRECHFADKPSPFLLKHLIKGERVSAT